MKVKVSLTVYGLFFQGVNLLKHHILIKTADVIVQHVSMDADAVQSINDCN